MTPARITILRSVGEGEALVLEAQPDGDGYVYYGYGQDSGIGDLLDDEDLAFIRSYLAEKKNTPLGTSWEDAVQWLRRYQWSRMRIDVLHDDWRERVTAVTGELRPGRFPGF